MVVRSGLPICLLAVLLLSLAPTAFAYSPDTNCAYVTDRSNYYVPTEDDPERILAGNASGYRIRVTDEAVELWVESNDLRGLQVAKCVDNDGISRDKDTKDDEFDYAKHLLRRGICERLGQDPNSCPYPDVPVGPLVPENGTDPVSNIGGVLMGGADNSSAFADGIVGILIEAIGAIADDPANATAHASGAIASITTAADEYTQYLGGFANELGGAVDNETDEVQAVVRPVVEDAQAEVFAALDTANATTNDVEGAAANATASVLENVTNAGKTADALIASALENGTNAAADAERIVTENATQAQEDAEAAAAAAEQMARENATAGLGTVWSTTDTANATVEQAVTDVQGLITQAQSALGVIQGALVTFAQEVQGGTPPADAAQAMIATLSGLVPA